MNRVVHIARREWLELGRQRAMLGIITTLFLCVAGISTAALLLLQVIASSPDYLAGLAIWMPDGVGGEAGLQALAGGVVSFFNWLIFSQLLGIVAVLAGHTVLHDRQVGALTFLLLAPVRRVELLTGKVLGALVPPLVLYLLLSGAASLLAASLSVTAPYADRLPPAGGWLVAFFLGGPAWALFTAALCAVVSSLARDVRTAQQGVWFVMFFLTFAAGLLLAAAIPQGAVVQLGVAGLGVAGAVGALVAGGAIISRDLSR